MIGIVVVSHSSKVAEGVVDIAKQVSNEAIPIMAAGGTSDGRIGTDAMKIMDAIKSVDQGKGVLIFVDLGSAILSAETAIDLLGAESVEIVDAPLVEGVIASSVQVTITDDIEDIKRVAHESKNISKI
jgi:PTS hybrid protein